MLDECTAAIADALPALQAVIARVAEITTNPEVEYDVKLGSHLAWLTSQVVTLSTELRQLEKHDRVQAKTPEQRHALVLSYLRQASPEQRAEALATLQAAGARSMLG